MTTEYNDFFSIYQKYLPYIEGNDFQGEKYNPNFRRNLRITTTSLLLICLFSYHFVDIEIVKIFAILSPLPIIIMHISSSIHHSISENFSREHSDVIFVTLSERNTILSCADHLGIIVDQENANNRITKHGYAILNTLMKDIESSIPKNK